MKSVYFSKQIVLEDKYFDITLEVGHNLKYLVT